MRLPTIRSTIQKAKSLPWHCRVALYAALVGLVACCVSFLFPSVPVGVLCFYFAVCWALWILNTILSAGQLPGVSVAIWSIINLAILVMFLSVTATVGDVQSSQGTELVWAISYLPMLLPLGWVFAPSASTAGLVTTISQGWFGSTLGGVVGNWLPFVFVAAVQGLVIMLLVWVPVTLLALTLRSRGRADKRRAPELRR